MDSAPIQRLNWGCGPVIAAGWLNADVDVVQRGADSTTMGGGVFPLDDSPGLPFGWTERFDGIVANHSLQCLTYDELEIAMSEFARVLKYGGRLRIIVPDVIQATQAYLDDDAEWPGFVAISEDWPIGRKYPHYLTWGGSNRSCFTVESLAGLARRHGLHRAPLDQPTWLTELDSRLGESIVVTVAK